MYTTETAARIFMEALREAPSPFHEESPLHRWLSGQPPLSYRERLTRPRRNIYNEVIPQMTLVKANIRRLKHGR